MVNPKQRRVPGKKQQDQVGSKTGAQDKEDWMVVKKQKITILIPPLPSKVQSPVHSVGEGQLQETPQKTQSQSSRETDSGEQLPLQATPSAQPCQESCSPSQETASRQSDQESAKPTISSPEQAIHLPRTSNPSLTLGKPPSLCNKVASENSSLPSFRENKDLGRCRPLDGNREIMAFTDSSKFLNRRMRASYLDKKLKEAGGLDNWLVSLGLGRFVKVFHRRKVGKFHLTNLTMEKLKVMGGTNAVGPRRKLMHAIDCLCEPHCFQHM